MALPHQLHTRPGRWALAITVMLAGMLIGCSGSGDGPHRLMVVYSNDMLGEIRSCGCATKDFGGLGRRATFINAMRDTTGGDFLLVEGGGFFSSEINYGKEKAEITLKSLGLMDYHGIVVGHREMSFGVDYIVTRCRELKLPVVVSNLFDASADTLYFPPTREVELASGLRVGLIGVIGESLRLPPQVKSGEVRVTPAIETVKRHAAELEPRVDLTVVLAHMSRRVATRLARDVPEIDLVVLGSEGRGVRRNRRFGGAFLLQMADQGRYMGAAQAILENKSRIRRLDTTVNPLGNMYPDDVRVAKLFKAYDIDIAAKERGRPVGMRTPEIFTPFSTASACEPCHEEIYAGWNQTGHAHAMDILRERSREYDRDCIPCHSTGFYEQAGFEGLTSTPDLEDVQCESCHGNATDHVDDPDVATTGDARASCRGCHNADQSPEFEFGAFWERIRH